MRTKLDGWKRKGQLRAAAMKLKKLGVRGFLGLGVALLMVATVLRMHMRDVSASLDNESTARLPGTTEEDYYFQCDRSHPRTDICNLKGDIQKNGTNSFVLYTPETFPVRTEALKPYTRKWEEGSMRTVNTLTLTSRHLPHSSRPCDVQHKVPGVIFSTSGYTGNLYHEFNDGLIPLWITTQHLNKEVVIIISSYHNWWYTKYSELVKQLTKHEIVDLERDNRIHCFPEIEAGLHIHGELAVDPNRMPDGATIVKFREFLNRAYKPGMIQKVSKPRLTIILRKTTRRFLNVKKITELGFQLGYDVSLLEPEPTTELRKIFRLLHRTDVLLGVHGAAMTHFLFMRPGTVFIQIVPLGTDWAANEYYGEPAIKLGLHYMPYKIEPAESSLSDRYDATDPVLVDPESITQQGWEFLKKVYLEGQDVRPSLRRLRQFLVEAKGVATLSRQSL